MLSDEKYVEIAERLGMGSSAELRAYGRAVAEAAAREATPANIRERWNIERASGGDLLVCFNDHEKCECCEYERFVPHEKLAAYETAAREAQDVGDVVVFWCLADPVKLLVKMDSSDSSLMFFEDEESAKSAAKRYGNCAVHRIEYFTRPQASATVPDDALRILDSVLADMEEGFIRCDTCGDQTDTKDIDAFSELKRLRAMLAASQQDAAQAQEPQK